LVSRLAILSYHKVGDAPRWAWEPWNYVPEAAFVEHLRCLDQDGWQVIELPTALRGLSAPERLPQRSALLTFDDGYRSVLERALPVMAEFGYPGVVFVPVAYIGGMSAFDANVSEPLERLCGWSELCELDRAGISVQSHGFRHVRFSELQPHEIEVELVRSKAVLEEGVGKDVEVFAFPYGDVGADPRGVARALESCGYRAACLYGGGSVALPAEDQYRLSRLAIGSDTDLAEELARPPGPITPARG
jgi:peptidoglycan/xylan/chitin deacetylase (PgdA/CDA1 family)